VLGCSLFQWGPTRCGVSEYDREASTSHTFVSFILDILPASLCLYSFILHLFSGIPILIFVFKMLFLQIDFFYYSVFFLIPLVHLHAVAWGHPLIYKILINVRYLNFLLSCSCELSQVFWNLTE